MSALILARNTKGIIGIDGKIPWHLPEDLKRFKNITTVYNNMVMGRKTFESLPMMLPGRKHYVLTRNKDYQHKDAIVINDYKELDSLTDYIVIGGAEVANRMVREVDSVFMTTVYKDLPTGGSADIAVFDFDLTEIANLMHSELHSEYKYEIWETWT